ncbi:MAG: endo-1,4-beta-xylanase [Spirochaetes bacterium]|nr:endo-1,4-beta-xylanase [Spirochaetota bacterium]
MKSHIPATITFICIMAMTVYAQVKPIPAGGKSIYDGPPLKALTLTGKTDCGSAAIVPVTGMPFSEVLRAETTEKVATTYALQLNSRNKIDLAKGDVMLAVFTIRATKASTEEAAAKTSFVFERASAPYTKSKSFTYSAGFEWTTVYVPFKLEESYKPGEAQVNFQIGYPPQEFEIGGFDVLSFGKSVKLEDLPATQPKFTWAGRAMDAPWRIAAEERIEKIRKGDLRVTVTDAAGKPVTGALVSVSMKRHAFGFGSAVSAKRFMMTNDDGEKYRAIILSNYSRIVFENDLKWGSFESSRKSTNINDGYNISNTMAALAILEKHGIEVRGHCLVWPAWRNAPKSLSNYAGDVPALRKTITDHIIDEVSYFKGRLVDWDVVNEVYANHNIIDLIGNGPSGFDEIVEWFKHAKTTDTKPNLYVNDYSILSSGGNDTKHIEAYEALIKHLIDAGAPLDGIGMQSHMGSAVPPETLLKVLDRFAVFGKKISSTEFDMSNFDDLGQAEYLRDFMTALFSHASVDGIIMWGFWENAHWLSNKGAHLYKKDWTPKPAALIWIDLVKKKWWTDVKGSTDTQGSYSVHGFLGDYVITVQANGRTKTVSAKIVKEGTGLTISIE